MDRIVQVHHPKIGDDLLKVAMNAFYGLREYQGLRKPPSTSELVDWLTVLMHSGLDAEQLGSATVAPFLGVLLKEERDIQAVTTRKRRHY